ncbi:MAG: hypothetical protein COA34_015100 [Methylophaga sp.]|uniref:hypothetical protein n=1 Tax=Methylophaga sp. TaxID=2024840 RepID=UPI000C0FEEC7|nr:hypothetical protein [Methylophaga sp.]MBL1459161.1 hypothetical protein [Methylophaga sp.]
MMKTILFILFTVPLVVMADITFSDEPVPFNDDGQLTRHDSTIILSQANPNDSSQTLNASPEAKKEMQKVYQECQKDSTLSAHYDCKCWSNRFLEERLKAGPKTPAYNIKSGISNQCFNIPGAAEYALSKCEGYGKSSYDLGYNEESGMSFDEYCQCVSNNYAIQLDNHEDRFTRQTSNKFLTSSHLRCQVPQPGDKNVWERLDQ